MNIFNCETCQDKFELADGSGCPDCCPHDDLDHGYCINCGADRTDWLVARAEAAYEGER